VRRGAAGRCVEADVCVVVPFQLHIGVYRGQRDTQEFTGTHAKGADAGPIPGGPAPRLPGGSA